MVHANLIANSPLIPENVTHGHKLVGENVKGLRGKTVHEKSEPEVTDYVQIPPEIVQKSKYVMLTADVMLVNNLPFVVISGQGIGLIIADFMSTHPATQLACILK